MLNANRKGHLQLSAPKTAVHLLYSYFQLKCTTFSNEAYPGIGTCLSLVVALVIGSLIELTPQRFGLPAHELGFELGIKIAEVIVLDLKKLADVTKVAQDGFQGGGVAELIEGLLCAGNLGGDFSLVVVVHFFVLRLADGTKTGTYNAARLLQLSVCHYLRNIL